MNKIIRFLIIFLFLALIDALSAAALNVTYIANEGFLLQSGDDKILIDALFQEGPYSKFMIPSADVRQQMIAGEPPFGAIDAVLVTHYHWDHFDAETSVQFLQHHPESILVGGTQVHEKLRAVDGYATIADQVREIDIPIDQGQKLSWHGIDITAVRLRHGPFMENGVDRHRNVQNIAYFVDLCGNRIFHIGDAGIYNSKEFFQACDFEKNRIDVLFSSRFDKGPFSQSIINERIKPQVIIPMHIPPGNWENVTQKFLQSYPEATLFGESLETKTFDIQNKGGRSTEPRENVSLTILYDNYLHAENLQTDWGFACLIEGLEKTVLFDTGKDGAILLDNADALGVDFNNVDVVVISHDHRDHYGGLEAFLKDNHQVDVYLLDAFAEERASTVQQQGGKVVKVKGPQEICRGLWTTGPMGNRIIEQSLVLETTEGAVVITGCAHPGIVSIVKKAQEIVPKNIHTTLGGFHLLRQEEEGVQERIKAFRDLGVLCAGPTHCSGDRTIALFQQAYGDHFVKLGVGRRLLFTPKTIEQPVLNDELGSIR